MALKVELKPDERIIIGTAVIRNADQRTRLFIEGEAPILREKDILTAATADTPAKKIYLALQLMYLSQDVAKHHQVYFELVRDFLAAAPSALPLITDINNRILGEELYRALKLAKRLIAYEQELISHATSDERLRQGGAGGAASARAGSDGADEVGGPAAGDPGRLGGQERGPRRGADLQPQALDDPRHLGHR
jgi:flagellar protein FlbT